MHSITPRRDFHDPDDYVDHVARCRASSREPLASATIAERHAALDQWPEYARRWLPPASEGERLGIDPTTGKPVATITRRVALAGVFAALVARLVGKRGPA